MQGKLRWLSAAFIDFISEDGKRILFDPWTATDGNNGCPFENEEFMNTNLILVSHDHQDHIGSAASICKLSKALLGGPDESMKRLCREEGLTPDLIVNNGGGYIVGGGFENEWIKVVSTPAHHSSNTSMALGTIAILKNGPTLYHTGDTSIVAEMEIYGRLYPVDIVCVPIFNQCMMDYIQAVEAVRLINPKIVIPIHFDANKDPLGELNRFIDLCGKKNPSVKVIKTEKNKWYDLKTIAAGHGT
jgi:L-ascorbate metabolism protein UlaG (beta-lactamase superfamily)